ncbi:MAG: hypothetical protein ACTHLU_07020 [Novosphingobium sp.]
MEHLVVLLALLPALGPADVPQDLPGFVAGEASSQLYPPPEVPDPLTDEARLVLSVVTEGFRPPVENQVRIEQRITIRIAPRAGPPPAPFRPFMLDQPDRPRISERHAGKCLPIAGIAGVQVGRDNRLMLSLRDRRVISLGLEKGCRAQDFYSGFYVERSSDGQLCVDRDRLQSRSGANCALTRLRQLVEE